jgi:hypothetical protein
MCLEQLMANYATESTVSGVKTSRPAINCTVRNFRRTYRWLGATALMAVLAAGCGGGGPASDATEARDAQPSAQSEVDSRTTTVKELVADLTGEVNAVAEPFIAALEQADVQIIDGMLALGEALGDLGQDIAKRQYPGIKVTFLIEGIPVLIDVSDGEVNGCVAFNESASSAVATAIDGPCPDEEFGIELVRSLLGNDREALIEIFGEIAIDVLRATLYQVGAGYQDGVSLREAAESLLSRGELVVDEDRSMVQLSIDGLVACGVLREGQTPVVVAGECPPTGTLTLDEN